MAASERAARVRVNGEPLTLTPTRPRAPDLRAIGPARPATSKEVVATARSRPIEEPALGRVVRDAIDHTTAIARDTVSIAALEARKALARVGPLLVWGMAAAVLGLPAAVLAIVALFLAAGALIPSVAARLALLALFLGAAAAFAALRASRVR